jgi:TonB family protein
MNKLVADHGIAAKDLEKYYRWVEPDHDVTVLLNLDTMDCLQRSVLNGIRSHGRTEVGGILLGTTEREENREVMFVEDFEPVPCEHRKGPSYVLTPRDADNFAACLARCTARGTQRVLGFYRSHHREGLFLSPDDMEIIQHHFRGPDNLFLLIKTLPNRACTAGFFFWKDGCIQSEFTGSEAPLMPIAVSFEEPGAWLGDSIDDLPVAQPAPVALAAEKAPAVMPAQLVPSHRFYACLIWGAGLMSIAAVAALVVLRYQVPNAPLVVQSTSGNEISIAAAKTLAAPPAPTLAAPTVLESTPDRTALPSPAPKEPARIPDTPKTEAPSSTEDTAALRSPGAGESTALPVMERSPGIAPPARPETTTAPSVPAPSSIRSDNPLPPAIELPLSDAGARLVPTVAEPAPPPSPAPRTAAPLIGPVVIHQVAPAVPRGVGPMITTDVQVDVAVSIDTKGKVTGARTLSAKGAAAGLLTLEALKAAQLFRFQPAQQGGTSVASSMVLTFRFAPTNK